MKHNIYFYGGGGKQWDVLIHNNNNKYQLSGLAEEYITMYARYIDTDYINLCSQVVNNLKNILLILNKIFFTIPYQ